MFIWVSFPSEVDTWELLPAATENRVAYIPGQAFAVHKDQSNSLRLNFSNTDPERIHEGIRRLAKLIRNTIRA
jgi:2-aminoadipate transaminase